jgi:hypothetical protein
VVRQLMRVCNMRRADTTAAAAAAVVATLART